MQNSHDITCQDLFLGKHQRVWIGQPEGATVVMRTYSEAQVRMMEKMAVRRLTVPDPYKYLTSIHLHYFRQVNAKMAGLFAVRSA